MKRIILLIVAMCSIATMVYFSSRTADISSQQSQAILNIIQGFGINVNSFIVRKLAHVCIFMIIGFCISMFFGSCLNNIFSTACISFIVSLGLACGDEYLQTFIPGRSGNFTDVIIDLHGVIIGLTLYIITTYIINNN